VQQWQADEYDPGSLALYEGPIPELAPNQVLMRVGAVSLNYRDKLALQGEFGRQHLLPIVPGSDAAGTAVAVGASVRRFEVGDRITSHFAPLWLRGKVRTRDESPMLGVPLPGVLAEYVAFDESAVVPTPSHLSDVEASTLPIAAVTAWSALFERCNLQPGETVLIQSTGGVALFALQLARAAGARVIVTSGSDKKLARAVDLGAHHVINSTEQPEWGRLAKAISAGVGVDHVINVAGGDSVQQSLEATRPGGNVVIVGLLGSPTFTVKILPFILQQGAIHTLSVGSREAFEAMNRSIEVSRIKPVIDTEYPFSEVPLAFERLDQGPFGKVVVRLPEICT
jgi:NADPH:quinone reductase-like Zn-dependent oxidoreductase